MIDKVLTIPEYEVGRIQLALMNACLTLGDKHDTDILWELLTALGDEGDTWAASRERITSAT